jgi:hypothetical protein
MSQFTPLEIANWMAIYLATSLCCAIAMVLSVSVALHGLWNDRIWQDARNVKGAALLLPRIWWRWQKLYLLSTPVTLGIIGYFAASLSWR